MQGTDPFNPFDEDDDAALRRAIALSLEEAGRSTVDDPIELSSDDEPDNLENPRVYQTKKSQQKDGDSLKGETRNPPQAPSASTELAGLNRKKMEEERLARLKKRKTPDSEQSVQDRQQKLKTTKTPSIAKDEGVQRSSASNNPKTPSSAPNVKMSFPKGAVKKTWAYGYPRTQDDIKIEEVLQKRDLQLAVLSSFQWDEQWMLSKIDVTNTRIWLIAFASSQEQQEEMKANTPSERIRFCFPPMLPVGNMHSKLMLLKFENYLRIVVPSGNLMSYDWGETGEVENIVFLIDLPKLPDIEQHQNILTPFGEELCYFLKAQGLSESLVGSLAKYDFSETNRYAFVHTIGRSHVGDDWKRTGYCGLGRAVSALGFNAPDPVEIDYIVSSMGSLNNDLISAIYYAAQGDDGLKEYQERAARGKNGKGGASDDVIKTNMDDGFRIYFPSHDTVVSSRGGIEAAGTICVQAKWWNSQSFPRQLIRDSKSVRPGLLVHSKMMFVRRCQSSQGWAYLGSANLSESAWGRLTRDKQSGNPKLTCRNWESGVIIPVTDEPGGHGGQKEEARDDEGLSAFLGRNVPVPITVSAEAYGKNRCKKPWLFMDN